MQFSFKHNIRLFSLLQDPAIVTRIYGSLISYRPEDHGRIDNSTHNLKTFLISLLQNKRNSSMHLNESGDVRLVLGSSGSINIAAKVNRQFHYMNEAETLELVQGIVVKSLVQLEESRQPLHYYFNDESLHLPPLVTQEEMEARLDIFTDLVDGLGESEESTWQQLMALEGYGDNYQLVFAEFKRLNEENRELLVQLAKEKEKYEQEIEEMRAAQRSQAGSFEGTLISLQDNSNESPKSRLETKTFTRTGSIYKTESSIASSFYRNLLEVHSSGNLQD